MVLTMLNGCLRHPGKLKSLTCLSGTSRAPVTFSGSLLGVLFPKAIALSLTDAFRGSLIYEKQNVGWNEES